MTREDMFRVFGNIDDSFIVSAEIKRSGKAFGLSETDKGTAESNLSAIIPPQSSAMESTSDKKDPVVSGSGTERTIVMDVVRKKSRKIKIVVVAALIVVTAAAAAVYLGTKKDKNENKEKIITNYFKEDDNFKLSLKNAYPETFTVNENGFYFGGYMMFDGEVNYFLKLYDASENKKYEADLSGYDGEYFTPLGVTDDDIWVYGTDSSGEHDLLRISRDEMKISGRIHFSEKEWIYQIGEDDEGNFIAEKYILEGTEITDWTVSKYNNELQSVSEKSVVDKEILSEENTLFRGYTSCDDGRYFTVYSNRSDEYTLYAYSPDGELLYSKENIESDMEGNFSGIMTDRNGEPVIYSDPQSSKVQFEKTQSGSLYLFDKLDPDTGNVTGRYETAINNYMLSGWANISRGKAPDGFDFTYFDQNCLYGCSIEDEKTKLIVDFTKIEKEGNVPSSVAISGDLILYSGQNTNEIEAGMYICRTDLSGNITAKKKTDDFGCGPDATIRKIRSLDNGDLWILCSLYDEDSNGETFFMVNTDPEFNVKATVNIEKKNDHCYYQDFIADSTGRIAIMDNGNNELLFCNSDGTTRKSGITASSLFFFTSGDTCCFCEGINKKSGTEISSIDFDSDSITVIGNVDYNISDIVESDGKYDVCFVVSDGIYGYNLKDNKSEELINWLDSDFDYVPYENAVLDENTIIVGSHDFGDNSNYSYGMGFRLLRRVDEETLKKIQERRVISIAVSSLSFGIKELVTEFNKNNEEYRIHLDDYGKYIQYDSYFSESGISALEHEVIIGNVPDMVYFDADFDYTRYVGFDAFTDINTLLSEADLNRDDYFENVLDSMKVNGRQYALPLTFALNGLAGNQEITGDIGDIKLSELAELQSERPLFYGEPYRRIIDSLIYKNISEFVDTENYSCDFDNQNFKNVLEIIKECGVTEEEYFNMDHEAQEDGGRSDYETRINKGKCMFEPFDLASFSSYASERQRYALKEMTFTGLPSGRKSGPVIQPVCSLAVFDTSDKKDGVTDFLKFMLSDDVQIKMNSSDDQMFFMYSLPIKRSVYEQLWERDVRDKNTTSTDCYGKNYKVKSPDIHVRELFDDMIASATVTSLSDSNIRKIIAEQTEIYLVGDQTAEETEANIQKKVTMYLKEIK